MFALNKFKTPSFSLPFYQFMNFRPNSTMVLYLSNTTWTHYQLHPQYIVDSLIVCFGMDKVNNTFDMLALTIEITFTGSTF